MVLKSHTYPCSTHGKASQGLQEEAATRASPQGRGRVESQNGAISTARPPHFLSSNGSHPVIVWTEKARSWGGRQGSDQASGERWREQAGARSNVRVPSLSPAAQPCLTPGGLGRSTGTRKEDIILRAACLHHWEMLELRTGSGTSSRKPFTAYISGPFSSANIGLRPLLPQLSPTTTLSVLSSSGSNILDPFPYTPLLPSL